MNNIVNSVMPWLQEHMHIVGWSLAFVLAIGFVFLGQICCCRIKCKASGELKILETKALGGRKFLALVGCGSQKVLLAVEPNGIRYLCQLASEEKEPQESKVQ